MPENESPQKGPERSVPTVSGGSPASTSADAPSGRGRRGRKPFELWKRPELKLQTTTHWTYPSQHYGFGMQGHKDYTGATPSWVIWNLLERYTREGDTVLDPMCGSGTTLDVCGDTGRQGLGFDLAPYREDIRQADARKLPLAAQSVDFVFVDPPYSTHVKYSGLPQCIGELDSRTPDYFQAMDQVIGEIFRVLKNRRYMALYVADSFKKGKPFSPIGFELFALLRKRLKPVDIICVQRGNRTLKRNHWHTSAIEGNYFLRGFNYLFIFKKEV
jgi:DNA modification methylase